MTTPRKKRGLHYSGIEHKFKSAFFPSYFGAYLLKIGHVTLLVNDIDEAISFYTEKLGFVKRADLKAWLDTRWVSVSPKDQPDVALTLVEADTFDKMNAVGKQAAGHVYLFLETEDILRDYKEMQAKAVNFILRPEEHPWGITATLQDLYGNIINLIQRP